MVPVRLDRVNVAVHVRRGFDANSTEMPERNFGGALQPNPRYMNLEIVETVMNQIRHKHKANPKRHGGKALLFHIYSIGDPKEFDGMVAHGDVQLQLDRQAAETWHAMATADILVTSTSTLSFTAALVNTHAEVYYAMTIFQNLIPGFIPFDAHAILEPMKGICPLDKAPTPPPGSHHPSRPAHQLQRRLPRRRRAALAAAGNARRRSKVTQGEGAHSQGHRAECARRTREGQSELKLQIKSECNAGRHVRQHSGWRGDVDVVLSECPQSSIQTSTQISSLPFR